MFISLFRRSQKSVFFINVNSQFHEDSSDIFNMASSSEFSKHDQANKSKKKDLFDELQK